MTDLIKTENCTILLHDVVHVDQYGEDRITLSYEEMDRLAIDYLKSRNKYPSKAVLTYKSPMQNVKKVFEFPLMIDNFTRVNGERLTCMMDIKSIEII